MTNFRVQLRRGVQFTLLITAESRMDVLRIINNLAKKYDEIDKKETEIISIEPVLDPFIRG